MGQNDPTVLPGNFSLLIKPAGPDCNARCEYCFYTRTGEHLQNGRHRMPTDVLRATIEKLLKLRLPTSQFCWQGGEPTLMGLDWFRQAIALQGQLGHGGQVVSNAIQTNGLTVDDAWAGFFRQYRFLVGVSFDGPADVHDHYRGRGTHPRVLQTIGALKRHGVQFNVLTVVNRLNEDHGRRTYQYLRDQGLAYLQFIPAVETDERGRPLPFAVTPEGYGRFMCDVFDAWQDEGGPGKVYVRTFEAILCHLAGASAGSCIMGRRCNHYLVVEHNGDVYPCDFFVRPDLRIGNIVDSELPDLVRAPMATAFADAKAHWPDACTTCEYLSVCHGGCLKDRERRHHRYDHCETYLCPSYKRFYSHTLDWFKRTAAHILANAPRPPRRSTAPPPQRNTPCPCGSEKKFKQCCGKR